MPTGDLDPLVAVQRQIELGFQAVTNRLDQHAKQLDKIDHQLNGDGSPNNRGWLGRLADMEGHVTGLRQWLAVPISVLVSYVSVKFGAK